MASLVKERLKTVRIPLAGSYNTRGIDGYIYYDGNGVFKDQRFVNCVFTAVQNPFTKKPTLYVDKRTGLVSKGVYSSGNSGKNVYIDRNGNVIVSQFYTGGATYNIYYGTSFIGTTDAVITQFSEAVNPSAGAYILMPTATGGRAYLYDNWLNPNLTTFTCDTTNGSPNLTNVAGSSVASQLKVGQKISGTGIPSTARIQSYDSSTGTIVMGTNDTTTVNATATNTGITVTYEHIQKIMDSDFPTHVGPMIEMDGTIFVMDGDGNIWNSELNNPMLWSSTGFISTNRAPDIGAGLARFKNYLVAFSSATVEFFKNVGNPDGSPLAREDGLTLNHGVLAGSAITYPQVAQIRDILFWKSKPIGPGTTGIWMFQGGEPVRISTPIIERIMLPAGLLEGYMQAFEYAGKTFLYIGSSSAAAAYPSFLYCVETGEWTETGFSQNVIIANGYYEPILLYLSGGTAGKIYTWSTGYDETAVYADDSTAYTMLVQTSKLDFDSEKRKRFHKIALIGDTQSSTATVSISWSDDDYDTFTTTRTVDMTNDRAYLTNCGSARRRAFRIENNTNTPLRLEALEITYSELSK
jgi:hypothetical protein